MPRYSIDPLPNLPCTDPTGVRCSGGGTPSAILLCLNDIFDLMNPSFARKPQMMASIQDWRKEDPFFVPSFSSAAPF